MINNLTIKNFKSIVEANLSFGKVNLFIGANGSGKSNVLEAIGVLSSALGRSITPTDLELRGVRSSLPRLFKATFKNRNIPVTFSMSADFERVHYNLSVYAGDSSESLSFRTESVSEDGQKIIGRGPAGIKIHKPISNDLVKVDLLDDRGVWDAFSQLVIAEEHTRSILSEIKKYAIYTPQTSLMRGMATPKQDLKPLGLTGGRLAPAFSELIEIASTPERKEKLNKMFGVVWGPGWTDFIKVGPVDLNIVPSNITTMPELIYARDRYMHTTRNYLSAYDVSEGTLYLMFVATLLAHPDSPNIFALDNVDGTLNPKLVRSLVEHLVRVVCKGENWLDEDRVDRQVFLTSHNPTALDALDIFNPDHKVFVVQRDIEQGGSSVIKPLLPPKGMTKEKWLVSKKGRSLSHLLIDDLITGALG